jgi:hypothetical protein
MNSSSAHSSRDNLQKSVEERKEEYNKARARIFNNSNSSTATDERSAEEVTLPSTLHRSTSLELVGLIHSKICNCKYPPWNW